MKRKRKRRDRVFEKRLSELKKRLDERCGQLIGMVDRLLLEHGFNPKTRKFANQPDRKIVEETNKQTASNPFGVPIPPCPICGVIPHNWPIHEEWRHLPGAKSVDKIEADREASIGHSDREPKPAPLPTAGAIVPTVPGTCGICGSSNYVWDNWLDFHICLNCGAHETVIGWQAR